MEAMEAIPHDAALLLPEGTRLLHIGPPKTGTTTVQAAFHAAAPRLTSQGVHYAGRTRHPRRAAFAVTGRRWLWGGPAADLRNGTDLVYEVRAARLSRCVVISSEASRAGRPMHRSGGSSRTLIRPGFHVVRDPAAVGANPPVVLAAVGPDGIRHAVHRLAGDAARVRCGRRTTVVLGIATGTTG